MVQEAKENLRNRGINPEAVSIDDLLDREEVERVTRLFQGDFCLKASLDQYDILIAVAAGIVAAMADIFVIRIPRDVQYLGELIQRGSAFTKRLHSLSISSDNPLARHCRVSFDKVASVAGFNPITHRFQTFGHDPLVGLLIGTIDIMRGSLSGISRNGEVFLQAGVSDPVYNPFEALVIEILHLFSDAPTKIGIPPPGWSILQLLQSGIGEKDHTISDLARLMYLKGYDSRHFLTMNTSVAAAEIVLRGYFQIRRCIDEAYAAACDYQESLVETKATSHHPRFIALAFAAHAIGAAGNAGKIVLMHGNPLAFNYPQWVHFLQAALKIIQMKIQKPTDVLTKHAHANLASLEETPTRLAASSQRRDLHCANQAVVF